MLIRPSGAAYLPEGSVPTPFAPQRAAPTQSKLAGSQGELMIRPPRARPRRESERRAERAEVVHLHEHSGATLGSGQQLENAE